jgi:hypothetical protein
MFGDEEGIDRFGFSMMERQPERNVTYELGLIAKAFVFRARKHPRVTQLQKYPEIVARMLKKLERGADPFEATPIHPSTQFLGAARAFIAKEVR